MNPRICFTIVLFFNTIFSFAQVPSFGIPIEGQYLKDYFIVNYVDWSTSGIKDYNCGDKTYDGHKGTDFALRSFRQMDSGVFVLSADAGKVISVVDSFFDRNKDPLSSNSGNMIAIQHSGGYYTYYAHLMKNSALVKTDDIVVKGQKIAKVASSGKSSDPHLHFEVWYNSVTYVDPFKGSCGNPSSMWTNQPVYDSNYRILESGLLNFMPDLDTIRERPKQPSSFKFNDKAICLWVLESGIKNGDSATWQWFDPDNNLYYSYTYTYTANSWYFYNWSYITFPHNEKAGSWQVKYLINGKIKKVIPFTIQTSSVEDDPLSKNLIISHGNIDLSGLFSERNSTLTVFNTNGQQIIQSETSESGIIHLEQGIYLILLKSDERQQIYKVLVY